MKFACYILIMAFVSLPIPITAGQKDQHSAGQKWDRRYDKKAYVYGTAPVRFLKEQISRLGRGKALVLAAGEGRNAVYLAEQGFQVVAVDISKKGLTKCRQLAEQRGVKVETIVADLNSFDLGESQYDLITDFYYYQADLFPKIIKALKPGGKFIMQNFSTDQPKISRFGPRNPAYLVKPNELLRYFANYRIRYYEDVQVQLDEGMHAGKGAVIRLIVEKAPTGE